MYALLFLFGKSDNPRLISTMISEVHYQEHQRNMWTEEFPESPDKVPRLATQKEPEEYIQAERMLAMLSTYTVLIPKCY